LVEDNIVNQKVAVKMLTPYFGKVDVANNGSEALDILNKTDTKYAAVFMDITMPIMDGFEATAKIRAMPKWRGIPIVALTAITISSQKQCVNFGIDEYLSKPLHKEQLLSVLQKLSLIQASSLT